MSIQHTPGPWRINKWSGITSEGCEVKDATGQYTICQLARENHEANAKLIAEAPEMLQALRLIAYMSDPGSYEKAINEMKRIAIEAIKHATA